MSRIRIVGGTITKKTGGNHSIYTDGNIVQNAGKAIKETSDKGVTHDKPKNPPPAPLLKKYFVDGWWSSDEAGDKRIKEALIGDHVYFHIKTKDIPNGGIVQMKLYDDDNNEKNEPKEKGKKDHDDFKKMINTQGNQEVASGTVKDNKVVKSIMLENFESFIKDETDKQIELYYRCSYKTENVEFPRTPSDYLKVKEKEPLIIFVCGYWNKDMPYAGAEWGKDYWGRKLKDSAMSYFNTKNKLFLNGAGTKFSSGKERYIEGQKLANERYTNPQSKFYIEVFKNYRKIMIVSHSMGGSYAEGIISFLKSKKIEIEKIVHLSPADTSDFSVSLPKKTYQIDIDFDPVLMYKNADDGNKIKGAIYSGLVKNPKGDEFGHMYTKDESFVWKWFEDLETITFSYDRSNIKYVTQPGSFGPSTTTKFKEKIYKSTQNKNSTQFIRVIKNNEVYHYHAKDEYETYEF